MYVKNDVQEEVMCICIRMWFCNVMGPVFEAWACIFWFKVGFLPIKYSHCGGFCSNVEWEIEEGKQKNLSNWPNHHFQNYWIWSALKKRMKLIEGCWEFYRNDKFGCITCTRKEPFTSSLNHNNSKMGGTILFGFYECLFKFNFHHFNSSFK